MDEIGEGGLSAIALQERLECADKTRRMVGDAWGQKVCFIATHMDQRTAHGGSSSSNANRACSPRGSINLVAEESFILPPLFAV